MTPNRNPMRGPKCNLTPEADAGTCCNLKALNICAALLAEYPRNADYWLLLANTCQRDGDYPARPAVLDAMQKMQATLELLIRGQQWASSFLRIGD